MLDREQAGLLRQRAKWLGREEMILAEMVLDRGNSFQEIARLLGQPDGTVRRRFGRLMRRLVSRETLTVMRSHHLDAVQQSVAKAYYLEGLSQKAIVKRTGCTPYFVRKTLETVRKMARQQIPAKFQALNPNS
jgi:DNA-directed RNA polymerase specialized sigma24 family protein